MEYGERSEADALERRNMAAGIVHGAFFQMATAFAEPYALLPLFLAGFTSSKLLIGLAISLIQAAMIWPQLPVSHLLRRRPQRAKPLMLAGIWTRCGVWGMLGAATLLMPQSKGVLLWAFVVLLSLYSFAGGVAVIPFNMVISQTIPPEKRSSFFGWRLFYGGLLAMTAGYLVKLLLGSEALVWPRNFGVLFLLSFLTLILAYSAMSMFKFPHAVPDESTARSPSIWHEMREVFRTYPVVRKLLLIQVLTAKLALFLPFLTLYATEYRHIHLKWVGIFIICLKLGTTLGNLIWMPMGNRLGTRILIRAGIALAVVGLLVSILAHSILMFSLAFFVIGCALSGLLLGYSGYILEVGPPELRLLMVAINGTFLLPLYFMPLLGGWIADTMGYFWLLVFALAVFSAAFLLACTLCEPRRGGVECGPVSH